MRDETVHLPLTGTVLTDARTGAAVDLGDRRGRYLLSLIRHRF